MAISKQEIENDYKILELLFEQEVVYKQMVVHKIYSYRNRYSDIISYHKSRVHLRNGVNLDKRPESDYINACYVNSPFITQSGLGDKKIIATQGPLPETVDHYWQMLLENNVTMVVSTCKLQEQGRTKCERFWPSENECLNFNVSQNPDKPEVLKVNLVQKVSETQYLERRELLATKEDGSRHSVTQIHFTGWPDHGVPDGQAMTAFELMLSKFIDWQLKSAPEEKSVVHCSAGIGRTGTTIAIAETIINLSAQRNAGVKDPKFSIFDTVRRLREQRYGSVQTSGQYVFIHQFMLEWIKRNKFI